MSKRLRNILACSSAIAIGALLYILFRRNTYIACLFESIPMVVYARRLTERYSGDLFRYYFPDFLWCFSLSCGIQTIYVPQKRGVLLSACIAFTCGVLWEIMQWCGMVSGVGDVHDVVMYLMGAILSILINLKGEK